MQGPQLPALEEFRGQRLNLEEQEQRTKVRRGGSSALGPWPQCLPPPLAPGTSIFSEAHCSSLGPYRSTLWPKSLADYHLYVKSQLQSHFLQEAFSDLLGKLWHP